MKKKTIYCLVSVHWIKAEIMLGLGGGRIDLETDSLRDIANKIKLPKSDKGSAQKIKHHLDGLVNMGAINKIAGKYIYDIRQPFAPHKRWHPTT